MLSPMADADAPVASPDEAAIQARLEAELGGVVPFKIEGRSKLTRAQAIAPYAEAGNFYLPRRGAWVPDFIEEHAAFPHGAHDDMVDTTSMAGLRMLLGYQWASVLGSSVGSHEQEAVYRIVTAGKLPDLPPKEPTQAARRGGSSEALPGRGGVR